MGGTRAGAPKALVLDAGALIAFDRGDKRIMALLRSAATQGFTGYPPA